jgi:hypothetical protein
MTADEDQPQPIVLDESDSGGRRIVGQCERLALQVVSAGLAAKAVDRLALRRRGDPRTRMRGHAVRLPPSDRHRECFGSCLLGEIEVAESTGETGDDPRPLLAVGARDHCSDIRTHVPSPVRR